MIKPCGRSLGCLFALACALNPAVHHDVRDYGAKGDGTANDTGTIQAAIDAGCTEVLMPKENERDVQMTPEYVKNKIKVRFVSSIDEVLKAALINPS